MLNIVIDIVLLIDIAILDDAFDMILAWPQFCEALNNCDHIKL